MLEFLPEVSQQYFLTNIKVFQVNGVLTQDSKSKENISSTPILQIVKTDNLEWIT